MILFFLLFLTFIIGQIGRIEPLSGFVFYLHDLVLIVFAFYFLTKKAFWRKMVNSSIFRPLLIFVGLALLSLLLNPLKLGFNEMIFSSFYLIRFTLFSLVYFAGRYLLNQNKISIGFLLKSLLATGFAISVLGFLQLVLYPNIRNISYLGWDPHFGRLVSTYLDPNFTGLLIVFTMLLVMYLIYDRKKIYINKAVLFICGVISYLALLFTYSRSSWLVFLIGAFYLHYRYRRLKYYFLLLLIFVASIILLPKPAGEGGNLVRQSSTLARVNNLQTYAEIFSKKPLLGYGFNTIKFLNLKYHLVSEKDADINHSISGVDNSFLFILITSGILGLTAFIYFIYKAAQIGSALLIASGIALLVHSLFQNSLFFPWVMIWMWILIAISEETKSLKV